MRLLDTVVYTSPRYHMSGSTMQHPEKKHLDQTTSTRTFIVEGSGSDPPLLEDVLLHLTGA